jgi:hypothetical protein
MKSAVCTMFEGHYHYGVAALTNSLYNHGFEGSIYAGYKGSLPKWASHSQENPSLSWPGGSTFIISPKIHIHFLPINTEYHLTNYKPNFMLQLWDGPAKDAESITYFDPDIVIKCKWEFFEQWVSHGVAIVHEISDNDMPPTHPLRKEWEKVIYSCNKKPTRELYSYINGGFCGVSKNHIEFLQVWKDIFDAGMNFFNLTPGQWSHTYDRTYVFYKQDQDALNITAMCCKSPISEVGPEGMDLKPGGWIMSHAIGSPKPWKKNFFLSSINAVSPSTADKTYWLNVFGPIKCFNSITIKRKRLAIAFSSFVSRFYVRT